MRPRSDFMLTVRLQKPHTGHRDIVFCLEGLTDALDFDSYYFGVELRGMKDDKTSIAEAIAILLDDWVVQLNRMSVGETIYLPMDFSDQYIGCIQVEKKDDCIRLNYGCIRIGSYQISSMSPRDFYNTTTEYLPDSNKYLQVHISDFCSAINTQASNLRLHRL